MDVLRELVAARDAEAPVALATVVGTSGSAPAQPGFKLLVYADGKMAGNVGGGELEERIRQTALEALAQGTPRTARFTLREDGPDATGMLCGGEVTVFLEPYLPRPRLVIVGGGHVGRSLAGLARLLEYEVRVVDPRAERATAPALDPAAVTPATHIVILTEHHESDEAVLGQVIDTPAVYIGMIGSRRKVDTIFDHLRAAGVPEDRLARVRAPIGLNLGGRRPNEIALAILAEIEMVRHGGSPRPRSAPVPDAAPRGRGASGVPRRGEGGGSGEAGR